MKRKTYERLHGKWEFRLPIPQRSMKELNKDIAWCRNCIEEGHGFIVRDYYPQLLTERTKRYAVKNSRK